MLKTQNFPFPLKLNHENASQGITSCNFFDPSNQKLLYRVFAKLPVKRVSRRKIGLSRQFYIGANCKCPETVNPIFHPDEATQAQIWATPFSFF